MATKLHACARLGCPNKCPLNYKYCGPECGRAAKTPSETLAVKGNTATLARVVGERVRTLADLVRVCEIDTQEWEIVSYECNKWDVGMKEPAVAVDPNAWTRQRSEPIVVELYQVKAKLKRRTGLLAVRDELEQMKRDAVEFSYAAPTPIRKDPQSLDPHLLQIAIPDVHMGKLAWKRETGQNYDLEIAERRFDNALAKLIQRTSPWPIGRVLFVVGSDLLHTDNPDGKTTKGTPQDTDGRFHKTFWKTRKMITRAIEQLRTIAPVDVLMVPGNHDTQTVWHLGDSLECWYHDQEDVWIDNAPTHRKYYQHGKVLLGFTHGDKGKQPDYPLLMATEVPEMFGQTKYREFHTGHIHQLQVREKHGVRVRVSPALCSADAWHSENQYVGNQRAAEAFVWHPEEGLISQATWTVDGDEE